MNLEMVKRKGLGAMSNWWSSRRRHLMLCSTLN
jgi:hypothetical protein